MQHSLPSSICLGHAPRQPLTRLCTLSKSLQLTLDHLQVVDICLQEYDLLTITCSILIANSFRVFFGCIRRDQAEDYVLATEKSFLLRISSTTRNCLALTATTPSRGILHSRVWVHSGITYHSLDERPVNSLGEAVKIFKEEFELARPCPGSPFADRTKGGFCLPLAEWNDEDY